jgi:tRNA pseudouridine32 synthase/23S rRNA pseudouridine746 synthase
MPVWDKYVLFIDGEAIVIDKPAGLAVHPGSRTPESLEDYLKHFRFGFKRAPLPVHRLDRDTSGCLLLARNPKAHKRFQRAFENKQVTKTYLAVLDGVPQGEAGVIDMPLAKVSSEAEGWRMVNEPGGRPSLTRWRRIAVRDGRAVILFSPETGRTHQIRVHAADGLGIPISGDPVYGGSNGPMLLHALSIRVDREGKPPVEATAPLPPTFLGAGFGDVLAGEPSLEATPPVPAAFLETGPSLDPGDVARD